MALNSYILPYFSLIFHLEKKAIKKCCKPLAFFESTPYNTMGLKKRDSSDCRNFPKKIYIGGFIMEDYSYLLGLAIILLSTKLLGLLSRKISLPQVVGALVAGILIGPACLGIVRETSFFSTMSEIGVILLMFGAGLETDLHELKKAGKASFIIALIGVIVPLLGGFGLSYAFDIGEDLPATKMLQYVFIGVVLTATSVSITVETLKELGKLNTAAGNAILGAAVIDDILGIIALTIITSISDPDVKIGIVLLKILGFFVFSIIAAVLFHFGFQKWSAKVVKNLRRHSIICLVFCLLLSYCAETFFGVADITGAYVAGLAISGCEKAHYVDSRFNTLSYLLLSPVFFASVGLKVQIGNMNSTLIIFSVLLVLVAILTKVVGCGLGAKLCRFSGKESLQIGVGMISRGEVALIVADKGKALGLMGDDLFGPIVIMVVITTVITPILLKLVFADKKQQKAA